MQEGGAFQEEGIVLAGTREWEARKKPGCVEARVDQDGGHIGHCPDFVQQ